MSIQIFKENLAEDEKKEGDPILSGLPENIQKGERVEYGQYQEQLQEAIQDLSMALELEED